MAPPDRHRQSQFCLDSDPAVPRVGGAMVQPKTEVRTFDTTTPGSHEGAQSNQRHEANDQAKQEEGQDRLHQGVCRALHEPGVHEQRERVTQ